MQKYVVLDKEIGETPLSCAEAWRAEHPAYADVPLAYAGRLDPMASGKLLVLIGEECKNQTDYHGLDKEYEFSVLFGIESDSLDVLGRLQTCTQKSPDTESSRPLKGAGPSFSLADSVSGSQDRDELSGRVNHGLAAPNALSEQLISVANSFIGTIELPYPKFSAKTVKGKPLHMWTLEDKLDEIEIPTKESEVYVLSLDKVETIQKIDLVKQALEKVNSIPEVTDPRKALGNDFRRVDVRKDWDEILNNENLPSEYFIAHLTCIASSGTYMRTLASEIAKKLGNCGLAWHIHRTHIGKYNPEKEDWDLEF